MYLQLLENIKEVLDHLQDAESKVIYEAWVDYAIDRKEDKLLQSLWPFMKNMRIQGLKEMWDRCGADGIIIYGAGHDGLLTKHVLDLCGYKVNLFCDTDPAKIGTKIEDVTVVSLEEGAAYRNKIWVIASRRFHQELYDRLISKQIPQANIWKPAWKVLVASNSEQYFDVFEPMEEEIFVDCGAYDGETTKQFKKWSKDDASRSYIFEPIKAQYEFVKNRVDRGELVNCEAFCAAVWNRNETLTFKENTSGSGIVCDEGVFVDAVLLDEVIKDKVTFIKMDIEGAELEALEGAKNTILKYRPRLAICLYHKPSDIFTIPAKLLELVPDYRFIIRHYSTYRWETVLYAY